MKTQSRIAVHLLGGLVFAVFFSGFINLIPTGEFSLATVIIDACYLLLALFFSYYWIQNRRDIRFDLWMAFFLALVLVYGLLFMWSPELLTDKILSWRSHVLYAFVAVVVPFVVRSFHDVEKLLRLICTLGVSFAGFGVAQFLLRNVLPEWLLVSGDTHVFGYYGTDIVRSTGLLGNTIIYGHLMLLIYGVLFCRMLFKFSWQVLAAAIITFSAVLCTFSRAAIAGAVILTFAALVFAAIYHRKRVRVNRRLGYIVLAGLAAFVVLVSIPAVRTPAMNSFIVRGLFLGENASVQGSTEGHSDFWGHAFDVLQNANPWLGLGIGTQSQGSNYSASHPVITDGAFIALFVEGGFVLLVTYSIFIAVCFVAIVKTWFIVSSDFKFLVLALGLFFVYQFGFSALINSAYFGKNSFIIFWIVFGLLMAVARISKQQQTPIKSQIESVLTI